MIERWEQLLGHERVAASLRAAVQSGRSHHAYLLLGPAGIGKVTLANLFAAALLCESEGDRPCGHCGSCTRLRNGTHTELQRVLPSGKSEIIGVDAIAEIQRKLAYKRLGGSWRVVLIDGAGAMSKIAQNKLLKTLEEPPQGTVLILCALHPGQLLQTVRSRCQKIALGPVEPGELSRWLIEVHSATPETATVIASASRGLPGAALQLLDPEAASARREQLDRLIAALSGDKEAHVALLRSVERDRPACLSTVRLIQELLRDNLLTRSGASLPAIHPDARTADGVLGRLPLRDLCEGIQRCERVRARLRRNVSSAGLLRELLLDLAERAA